MKETATQFRLTVACPGGGPARAVTAAPLNVKLPSVRWVAFTTTVSAGGIPPNLHWFNS